VAINRNPTSAPNPLVNPELSGRINLFSLEHSLKFKRTIHINGDLEEIGYLG